MRRKWVAKWNRSSSLEKQRCLVASAPKPPILARGNQPTRFPRVRRSSSSSPSESLRILLTFVLREDTTRSSPPQKLSLT